MDQHMEAGVYYTEALLNISAIIILQCCDSGIPLFQPTQMGDTPTYTVEPLCLHSLPHGGIPLFQSP